MADMVSEVVSKQTNEIVLAGERIRIEILNADGTQKKLILDDSVPVGKQLSALISYYGKIVGA